MKNKTHTVVPGEPVHGALWSRTVDPNGGQIEVQSIQDLEALLPPRSQVSVEDLTESIRFRVMKAEWEESKAQRAEMDLATAAVLRLCGDGPALIAIGNGKFRTGLNLASKHESFKAHLSKKVLSSAPRLPSPYPCQIVIFVRYFTNG